MTFSGYSWLFAMSSYVRLPGFSRLHLFQRKKVEMTLKVDQGQWRWRNSIGHHFLLVVRNNPVISYRLWDIQRRIMACI